MSYFPYVPSIATLTVAGPADAKTVEGECGLVPGNDVDAATAGAKAVQTEGECRHENPIPAHLATVDIGAVGQGEGTGGRRILADDAVEVGTAHPGDLGFLAEIRTGDNAAMFPAVPAVPEEAAPDDEDTEQRENKFVGSFHK